MKYFSKVLVLFLVSLGAVFTASGQEAGLVEYIEVPEAVSIVRNGEPLAEDVTFGTPVENFDKITTGSGGLVQIRLDEAQAVGSVITVNPNSSFVLELSGGGGSGGENRDSSQAGVSLLAGSIRFKVNKLAGREKFDVSTENTVMGVRGTDFTVSGTPGGECLSSCREGAVACFDESDRELTAEPGQVVQNLTLGRDGSGDSGFSAQRIPVSELDEFQSSWHSDRMEVLRGQAGRAVENYSARFEELYGKFNRSYARLPREILSKWDRRERRGERGTAREIMADKKEVIGPLKDMKIVMVQMEPVFFRLKELNGYYQQMGRSRPELRRFAGQTEQMEGKLDRVRYYFKLYARRNGGSFPLDFGGSAGGSAWDSGGSRDFMDDSSDFF